MTVVRLSLYPPDVCDDCARVGLDDGWTCYDKHSAPDRFELTMMFIQVNDESVSATRTFILGLGGKVEFAFPEEFDPGHAVLL